MAQSVGRMRGLLQERRCGGAVRTIRDLSMESEARLNAGLQWQPHQKGRGHTRHDGSDDSKGGDWSRAASRPQ